jgi:serine/threonine protein kinase
MQCQECSAPLTADARFCSSCGARIQPLRDVSDALRDALEKAIGFQYRIERPLGRGGMGAVYLAHELALDRDVAIKVLPPEQAGAPQLRERFRLEARTAARLNHPNIVPLYTFGEVNGLVYFVMGYVAGESLASRLRRNGPLASDEARTLLAEMADGLAYAHRHGVVHRDIKPDNILIDAESGSPRLTDFGIAKATFSDAQLTTTGQLIGTPAYMSPEQVLGRTDVNARSDLYSLGVVAYEMVSGRLPFDAKSPMDALTQRLRQEPRPLRTVAPNLAEDLIVAIHRCLEREPSNRWADAKSLWSELVPMDDETDDPLTVRLLRIWTGIAALIALALVYVEIFLGFNPGSQPLHSLARMLASGIISLLLMIVGASVALLRQGFNIGTIIRTAFRQPRGWRFWYPKRLRRRGDVWDRLPARLRRVRLHFAILAVCTFGIYIPLVIGLQLWRRPPAVQLTVQAIWLVVCVLLFVERQRAIKHIAATLGISSAEASKIISTPTWRTSAWQRGAAASLIRNETLASSEPRAKPTAASATLTESDDHPTMGY